MTSDLQQLQKRISALMTVQDIAQELMSEFNHWRLLNKILNAAVRVLNADTGSLLIWVPPDHLEFSVSANSALVGRRMPAAEGIAGWVFSNEQPLIVSDKSQDERWFREMLPGFETQSLCAVPLMTPTERIGVIEVLNKKSGELFNEQDRDILSALAAQAATAIVNARLYQELEEEKNRIVTIEDQTHRKLARDLHDGPAQTLASMMMDIEIIQKLHEHEPHQVPEELTKLRHKASKTLEQVRTTMFVLRPMILETQGLVAALESYVEQMNATEELELHLQVRDLDQRLPALVEDVCFAIIHEAVNNVRQHSKARNAWIIVERRPKDLIVAVRDDGKGFDVAQTEAQYDSMGRLGMLNMRERADMLGASYVVKSAPGRGTLIYLIVPLNDHSAWPKVEVSHGDPRILSTDAPQPVQSVSSLPPPYVPQGRRRKGTGPLHLFSQGNHNANHVNGD
jgi:signal transduction histidine kinase